MMAIGLVMLAIGFGHGVMVYDEWRSSDTVAGIFGWVMITGSALMVASAAKWLWDVMP